VSSRHKLLAHAEDLRSAAGKVARALPANIEDLL